MKPIDLVRTFVLARHPVMLLGAPGTGKTAQIRKLAEEAGAHLEVVILATSDPTDVGGWLALDARGVVQQSAPPWARRLRQALDQGKPAWLFLDEITCAPPSVQAAALGIVWKPFVAGLDLSGIVVVAAGNPPESAADQGILSQPLASRMAHVGWTVDAREWAAGELTAWGAKCSAARAKAAASVTGYLLHNTAALAPTPTAEQSSTAHPCPRTWSMAIDALAALPLSSADDAACAVAGCVVGPSAAAEWAAWEEARDLPDPELLLSDPLDVAKKALAGLRADQQLAAMLGVAGAAASEHPQRAQRLARAWQLTAAIRVDAAITPAQALQVATGGEVPKECEELGRRILEVRERLRK